MLEGGDDEPTRAYIENVILYQYDRLQAETSEAGAKELAVVASLGHHKPPPAPSKSNLGKQRSKFDGECFKCGGRRHRGEVRRLLHLRQSEAHGCQLSEALERGEWE